MNNADQPINPCLMQQVGDDSFRPNRYNDPKEWNKPMAGLSKREHFAGLFLQGILSAQTELRANGNDNHTYNGSIESIVSESLSIADELLKQLETTQD